MITEVGAAAIGREDGRANALTVVLPLQWWGRWWLTSWFWVLRLPYTRRFAFSTVDRLRFISAIRWSLLPPFDTSKPKLFPSQDQRWQLLFESNFDGDWDEYLDNFGAVLGWPLLSIVRPAVGFPGLRTPSIFKAYARAHDHVPELYASAYRELTAGDIRQEIIARYGADGRDSIKREGYGLRSPKWSTFLVPVKPGAEGRTEVAARKLDNGVFPSTKQIHFARLLVLRRSTGSWLLLSLVHDTEIGSILTEMFASLHGSLLRALMECLEGVPASSYGWWDDATMVDFLLRHRPPSTRNFLAYCAYPGYTVEQVQSFASDPQRLGRWPAPEAVS